ncbi:hypothetical protein BH09ACT10_BH09ACT10_31080 [soil metagenome]
MPARKLGPTLAIVAFALSACDGGDSDRPSVEAVARALSSKSTGVQVTLTTNQANCLAKVLVDSDVSNDALEAVIAFDNSFKASKVDTEALTGGTATASAACMAN